MSIIRSVLTPPSPPYEGGSHRPLKIHLLYGSRVPDDVIYGDELAELAAKHPSFDYTLVISEPPPDHTGERKGGIGDHKGDMGDHKGRPYLTGFLDADLIREQIGDPSTGASAGLPSSSGQAVTGKTFYICGPGVMYDFCLAALEELGVPRHKIRRELYGPPADVTREPGWPEGLSADAVFNVEVVGRKTIRQKLPAGTDASTAQVTSGVGVTVIGAVLSLHGVAPEQSVPSSVMLISSGAM